MLRRPVGERQHADDTNEKHQKQPRYPTERRDARDSQRRADLNIVNREVKAIQGVSRDTREGNRLEASKT